MAITQITLVSSAANGTIGNGHSSSFTRGQSISADGRYVFSTVLPSKINLMPLAAEFAPADAV